MRTLVCLLASLLALAMPARGETLLVVTDMHLDPMEPPSATPALQSAPPEQWAAILDGAPHRGLGPFNRDPGWPLVGSAFDAMRATTPHPDVVAVLGDLLAHQFRERFDRAASDRSEAAYRAFVDKTVAFQAHELAKRFPDTVILPVVGNNDDDCGDYALTPNGPFLAGTLPAVQRLVGKAADAALPDTWRATGSYVAHLGPHLRAVVANTVFFSIRYRNACGDAAAAPARSAMAFIAGALEEARQAGDKVWLLYHIPPGADAYQTQHRGACPDRTVPMWPAAITREFEALMHRYRDVVVAGFAGHTHMDEFRLIGGGADKPADAFTLVTPAVSPIFGQNPAFARYATDADGTLRDRTVFYLANLDTAADGAAPDWRAEYRFDETWGAPAIDAASLAALDRRLRDTPADQQRWEQTFSVARPAMWQTQSGSPTPSAATLRVHWCTEHTVDPAGFAQCLCAGAND